MLPKSHISLSMFQDCILYSSSDLMSLSTNKKRPLLSWVQSVHNNAWHGASPLITSAHTHLCDDEPFCHPVQSSKLSFGSPRSYGISFAFFPILPPPFPSFALKLPLLELLSCLNRYNLRRLPVLRWVGTYLCRLLF